MGRYAHSGAALVRCDTCGEEQLLEWKAGEADKVIPYHHDEQMRQVTHNDGRTPLEEPCPSYCCQRVS